MTVEKERDKAPPSRVTKAEKSRSRNRHRLLGRFGSKFSNDQFKKGKKRGDLWEVGKWKKGRADAFH